MKERKDPARDEEITRIINTFKEGAYIYGMNNYIVFLGKLLDAYERPLEFDMLQDQIYALQMELEELKKKQKPDTSINEIRSTF